MRPTAAGRASRAEWLPPHRTRCQRLRTRRPWRSRGYLDRLGLGLERGPDRSRRPSPGGRDGRPALDRLPRGSDRAHVDRARPLVTGLRLEADLGALGQGAMAVADDRALVDEEILRAIVGLDEAEALVVVEPLDCSGRHAFPPLTVRRARRCAEATTANAGTDCAT